MYLSPTQSLRVISLLTTLRTLCFARRSRISSLNDRKRNESFKQAMDNALKLINEKHGAKTNCLQIGDGAFLALVAAQAGATVVTVQNHLPWRLQHYQVVWI